MLAKNKVWCARFEMSRYLNEAAGEKAVHSAGMGVQSFGDNLAICHYAPARLFTSHCRIYFILLFMQSVKT